MGGTTGQSITLANSIIGVGILAMPFCFQQCGAVLAVVMLLLSGLVSRLACYFLLKSAIMARRRNFEFLAFHVFGAPGKLAVEVGIIGFLLGTCIAYFVVVGDLGPQIISKMFNINHSSVLRTCVMVLVSVLCVLPLGLLRNVDSLSNVCAATIGFYFCLVIKVIAEATAILWNGEWQSKVELWKPEGVLQCVPIFSMALFCQTQLFEIFETLPSLSLEKMNVVTKNALNICTVVYVLVGLFGYIAFCGQTISGNILVSLSPTMASDVIKLGFVMSLAFSFPLIIFPCRASLYSLLYRKVLPSHHDHIINHSIPEGTFRCITVAIVAAALLVSLMIPNIELVLGLVGSTIGVVVCVVFPAACFLSVTVKNTNERLLAKIILCLGIIVMVLGTYANLEAAESQLDHNDNRYISQEKIDKIVEDFFESNNKNMKSEDAIIKPEINAAEVVKKVIDKNKNSAEIAADKDSEVQPPNPVAPDIQPEEDKKVDNKPKIPAVIVKEDSKYKFDQSDIEGGGDKESVINIVGNKVQSEEKHLDAIKEAVNDKVVDSIIAKSAVNQDNLEILKQQELMETIKKHGEEQKQLIEEQKDILDNLKKTKEEIEKSKKETIDTEQVKKLAVESIKKMADMAIQSINAGGITDTPIDNVKSEDPAVVIENKKSNSEPLVLLQKAVEKTEKDEIGPPLSENHHIKPLSDTLPKTIENKNIVDHVAQPNINENKVINDSKKNNGAINQNTINSDVPNSNTNNKDHIHSADEPNSYVHGEILEQIKQSIAQQKLALSNGDALVKNVPLPLVMNQLLQNNPSKLVDGVGKEVNIEPQLPPNNVKVVSEPVKPINKLSREKRDIDCGKYKFLSEEERHMCRSIDRVVVNNGIDIIVPNKLSISEDIHLEKEDLVKILHNPNKNVLHHIRSLKSFDESKPS